MPGVRIGEQGGWCEDDATMLLAQQADLGALWGACGYFYDAPDS